MSSLLDSYRKITTGPSTSTTLEEVAIHRGAVYLLGLHTIIPTGTVLDVGVLIGDSPTLIPSFDIQFDGTRLGLTLSKATGWTSMDPVGVPAFNLNQNMNPVPTPTFDIGTDPVGITGEVVEFGPIVMLGSSGQGNSSLSSEITRQDSPVFPPESYWIWSYENLGGSDLEISFLITVVEDSLFLANDAR